MGFEITILGTNSAKPAYDRKPSAQLVVVDQQHHFLLDCGEGTQFQMNKYGVKANKISHIFITHFHGDHFLGILPLIDSYQLSGRSAPLTIYGPPPLKSFITHYYSLTGVPLKFTLNIEVIDSTKPTILFENKQVLVETVLLTHRVPCTGFIFREKPKERRMISEQIKLLNIPYQEIPAIKKGGDFISSDGKCISNELLTTAPSPPCTFAYCTDTSYNETIIPQIQGANLLYHETTYLEDQAGLAGERGHTTAREAGIIATKAAVKQLVVGHYSARYKDLQPFLEQAKEEFANSHLSIEGRVFKVN